MEITWTFDLVVSKSAGASKGPSWVAVGLGTNSSVWVPVEERPRNNSGVGGQWAQT